MNSLPLTKAKILLILCLAISSALAQNMEFQRQTGSTWNYNGNVFALGLHPVFCESNQVLSSFRLIRENNNMFFRFFCLSGLAVLDEQFTRYTDWNSTAGNKEESLNFLDRHELMCPDDSALNGFQMERSGDNIRFRYTCNRVKMNSTGSYTTDFLRSGVGEIQGLAVHEVRALDTRFRTQAIQGFRMGVRYVNQWCTILCSSFKDIRFTVNYVIMRNIRSEDMDAN